MHRYIVPSQKNVWLFLVSFPLVLAACATGVDTGEASSAKLDPLDTFNAPAIPAVCKFAYSPDKEEAPYDDMVAALNSGNCILEGIPTVRSSVVNKAGEEVLRRTFFKHAYNSDLLNEKIRNLEVHAVPVENEAHVIFVIEASDEAMQWGLTVEYALLYIGNPILNQLTQVDEGQAAWAEDMRTRTEEVFGDDLLASPQSTLPVAPR